MCNDYEQHVRWAEYRKLMQALDLAIPSHQSELDLPQADDIRINDTGPVMRATGNQIELVPMTFAFPPARPGGAPVFNFRSEGRHFANSNRCLIPASAFFEFTGKKYPKAKHRFALKESPITAIAGLWREAQGNHPPTFTMLTTAPGPDVAPYHNRQVVVVRPEDWSAWIYLTKPEAELLRPLPEGSLDVATVREGSGWLLVLARGRLWLSEVEAGTASFDDIAVREDCSKRHVNMMISLAFLAPNLVQIAAQGRMPQGIGVSRLFDAPAVWSRQHSVLGLS
jgi:putative SOS response-associated peptidase YedK